MHARCLLKCLALGKYVTRGIRPTWFTRLSFLCPDSLHADPDELDEEFDTFPTSRPLNVVKMRYDRLRMVASRFQGAVGGLASERERLQSLLSLQDPRATLLVFIFSLVGVLVWYFISFKVVALLVYMARYPRFRHKFPSVPQNFFKRFPTKFDSML